MLKDCPLIEKAGTEDTVDLAADEFRSDAGKDEEESVRQRIRIMLMGDNVTMLARRAPTITPAEIDGNIY